MIPSPYRLRHVKRFALTFLLVAGAVGAASLLVTSAGKHRQVSSPGALPTPDLNEFCNHSTTGAVAGQVNADSKFACALRDGTVVFNSVDAACVSLFGGTSRRVVLARDTSALRCVPEDRTDLGAPDFAKYCIALYGATSVASWVADDYEGWRCATVQNGIFQTVVIDFQRHEVDRICQLDSAVESFAEVTGSGLDGWRCFGAAD